MTAAVVGLDLSSSSTGLCADGTCSTIAPKGPMFDRCRAIADTVAPTLLGARLVVHEAIGTRHVNTAIAIATVHALVLNELHGRIGPQLVAVTPAQLKKYATGKGNAQKDQILLAAVRAGADVAGNDEADAWWLWAIGRHLDGNPVVAATTYRAAVIEAVQAP